MTVFVLIEENNDTQENICQISKSLDKVKKYNKLDDKWQEFNNLWIHPDGFRIEEWVLT